MAAIVNQTARMALACFLMAGCAAPDAAGDAPGAASAVAAPITAGVSPAPATVRVVDVLPLRRGYYVSTDTPCEQASNATLHMMRRDGSGYGGFTTPPYFCAFERIEQTGPSSYRVTESCGSTHGGDGSAHTIVAAYEILSDTSYRKTNLDDDWKSSSRRCPRGQLPAIWRDSDIGDFVD